MPHLSPLTSHFSPRPAAWLHNPALSLWLSVDPLSDKYPGVSPYVYCGNNPVRLVDVDGRFSSESRAIKYHDRAVERFGKNRVGNVAVQAGTSSKPNYIFTIYDEDGDKDRTWTKPTESGIAIGAVKGNCISRGREYRKYSGSGFNVELRFSIGAQAGGSLKSGPGISVNLNSIDLFSAKMGASGIQFDCINQSEDMAIHRGLSLGGLSYNYTESKGNSTHSFGIVKSKSGASASAEISNKDEFNFSFGAALIFGLHFDIRYKK